MTDITDWLLASPYFRLMYPRPTLAAPSPKGTRLTNRELTHRIIAAAIKIHRRLGPGLLESAYEACMAYELTSAGLEVSRQKPVPLIYDSVKLDCGFRADLVVDGRIAVELKCKEALHPVDHAQLLSHLRLLGLQVGLLINFHVLVLKDGVTRIVNNYQEDRIVEIPPQAAQL